MNTRELRLALKEKLEHRRELIRQNGNLRDSLSREQQRNDFLVKTLGNPLVNMALEECADQIMQAVIDQAIKASEVVANQTMDDGDYEIGISIPSLHIRRRLFRMDVCESVSRDGHCDEQREIKRVAYDGNQRGPR